MKITLKDVQDFFATQSSNFNQLTPAQTERLAILSEEMAEAQHVIGKILRHGLLSCNPKDKCSNNKTLLQDELGHVAYAVEMLVNAGDISASAIEAQKGYKEHSIKQYLHHQES